MKIKEIWENLENELRLSGGILLRRYASTVMPDIYVALRLPQNQPCIALHLRSEFEFDLSMYSNLKEIKFELIPDEKNYLKKYLLILLSDYAHSEIFACLCEDLILSVSHLNEEGAIVKELTNRLEKWKSLFDKAALDGLSPEEQRGLYGELYFLKKWILNSSDINHCLQAWAGPEMGLRDFQYSKWAIEVKTTYGNNHQRLKISSERQLDISGLDSLFIFHLSLEPQQKKEDGLNQMVDSLFELLKDENALQTVFRSKLMHGGYFNQHKTLYENEGYFVRKEIFYLVHDQFPRVEENDLRKGVGDIQYSIILSDYSDYIVNESSVFETIK